MAETEPVVVERGPSTGAPADAPDALPSDSSPIPGFMEGKGSPATDSTTGSLPGFMTGKPEGYAPLPPFLEQLLNPAAYDAKRHELSQDLSSTIERQMAADAAATEHMLDTNRAYDARMAKLNTEIGQSLDNTKPWNADVELEKRKTGLWEQFGSPGFIIAMVASAFTTMPMVSALNAGAAAMNAINQGDMDSYTRAFQAWKDNTELAIKRSRMEQEQFNNLQHLRENKMSDYRLKLEEMLRNNGDERKLVYLSRDMLPEIDEAFGHQFEASDKMAKAFGHLTEMEVVRETLMGRDDFKEAAANGDGKKIMQIYSEVESELSLSKNAWHIAGRGKFADRDFEKHMTDWERSFKASNPTITEDQFQSAREEELQRYGAVHSEAMATWQARSNREHQQHMEGVATGKLDLAKAHQAETELHHRNMEDRNIDKDLEVERHNHAMEELRSEYNRIKAAGGGSGGEGSVAAKTIREAQHVISELKAGRTVETGGLTFTPKDLVRVAKETTDIMNEKDLVLKRLMEASTKLGPLNPPEIPTGAKPTAAPAAPPSIASGPIPAPPAKPPVAEEDAIAPPTPTTGRPSENVPSSVPISSLAPDVRERVMQAPNGQYMKVDGVWHIKAGDQLVPSPPPPWVRE